MAVAEDDLPRWHFDNESSMWRLRLKTAVLHAVQWPDTGKWIARMSTGIDSRPIGFAYETAADAQRGAVEGLIPLLQHDLVSLDRVLETAPTRGDGG